MKDHLLDKIIKFDTLLGLTALIIAFVAAFFSIYGIATLFAGAFISTAIMASVLEVGKLVAVTYLYRFWSKTKKWLSLYLTFALLILMLITSGGIFGYLSAAYQKSSISYRSQQEQIVQVEQMKTYAEDKIIAAQSRIQSLIQMRKIQESRMSEVLTNTFISRNVITLKQLQDQTTEMIKQNELDIKTEQSKIELAIKEKTDIDQKILNLKFSNNNKDIRTFEFIATLFNTSLDNVVKWFIFLLIVVFDPLAIALILAYNVVVYRGSTNFQQSKSLNNSSSQFIFQKIPKSSDTQNISSSVPPISNTNTPIDPFYQGYFKSY